MRQLILMRHAEAVPTAIDGKDFDRPLSRGGIAMAKRAADQLRQSGPMPDGLLCSPALRTHQTAELMRDGLGLHDSILREDSRLYLATANGIRTVLAATSDDLQCLLLVAHNPAISALASLLSAEAAQVALATAHYRVLQLQLTNWLQLGSR